VRFENIFLLHGKGGSPDGSSMQLEEELRRHCRASGSRNCQFHRPLLLHSDPNIAAEDSLADLRKRGIPQNAALIGISLGGLVAAKFQEEGREDVDVICISSPTWADRVRLERRMPNRVAFYSSGDEVIMGRTKEWPRLAQAFDLPWMTHDTEAHKLELAQLAFAYLDGGSVPKTIQEVEERLRSLP